MRLQVKINTKSEIFRIALPDNLVQKLEEIARIRQEEENAIRRNPENFRLKQFSRLTTKVVKVCSSGNIPCMKVINSITTNNTKTPQTWTHPLNAHNILKKYKIRTLQQWYSFWAMSYIVQQVCLHCAILDQYPLNVTLAKLLHPIILSFSYILYSRTLEKGSEQSLTMMFRCSAPIDISDDIPSFFL